MKHIAIIMDGNGRWAQNRGLERKDGYKAGLDTLKKIIEFCKTQGIEYLTVFAFSTENVKRTPQEKKAIFDAVEQFIKNPTPQTKINFLGDCDQFKKRAVSPNDAVLTLNICLNYGAKADIVNAVNSIVSTASKSVDEKSFSNFLSSRDLPVLDAIIRVGGQKRLSNFMLFEAAYAELYFSDLLWPDFDEKAMHEALTELRARKRNYGA